MIKLNRLSFSYANRSRENLKDINLEIQDGEAAALIGLSGCGKTTLTRIINGLAFKFYEGNLTGAILLDGENPRNKELYEIGRTVGSVFQNPKSQFFAEIVEDEIAFGLENYGVAREEIEARIETALRSINGETLIGKNLFQLSSGERQKIAIASINALDPPVYVFDEPSANLDMKSVESLKELILSLKKTGKTIVISEHRIYYLRNIIDKYYYLENGRITASFTERELLGKSKEYYEQLGLRAFTLTGVSPKPMRNHALNNLRIENLSFAYRGNPLLNNLRYEFSSRNIYGIVGKNGVGKSTLAKILSGLLKEKRGTIFYNDARLKRSERRRKIYYLPNNPDCNLFEVSLEAELRLNNPGADTAELLRQFQLENIKNSHPQILSGGQKQRLSIAAAELLERDVYIFDEPTSGLDGKNMRLISERIRALQSRGKIVIVISHDYEFLIESCGKVLYLDGNFFIEFSAETDGERILEVLRRGGPL